MAEALALIGLVSNIFGFIELGIKLVSATQSLADAGKMPEIEDVTMQDLTKDDMRTYVRNTLDGIPRFRELSGWEPVAETLTEHIAKYARGVWLWVFLVARDLKHTVNRKEGLDKLKNIVDSFPQDLEEYFTRIISEIKPAYRDEMTRIFLAMLEGVQPLPLLAFSLLARELSDPDYAMRVTISSLASDEDGSTEDD
ncbi:hypothetical protein F5883DRAFT_646374 [Diaporthe sp. PMI_573]|nr:hypothetical protein F5883DRAFT_646374 [Diaporthaceae sp. PMI_573]